MAWLDFIKQIRKDEDEEEKRGYGAKNKIFGFLDDVLDVGERRVERIDKAFSPSDEDGYGVENRIQDFFGAITPEPVKDTLGIAAGAGREIAVKPFVKLQQSLDEAESDPRIDNINSMLEMDEKERDRIAGDANHPQNPLFRIAKEKYGNLNNETLTKRRAEIEKEKEDQKKPFTPEGSFQKALFGNDPIESVQGDKRNAQKKLEEWGATSEVASPLAGGFALGLAALDSPIGKPAKAVKEIGQEGLELLAKNTDPDSVVKFITKSTNMSKKQAREVADDVASATTADEVDSLVNTQVKSIRDAAGKVTDGVAGDRPRISVDDQAILSDYSDYLVGANPAKGSEANDLIAQARIVGNKHGIDLTNGSVEEKMDRATGLLDDVGRQTVPFEQGRKISQTSSEIAQEYRTADELANDVADSMHQMDAGMKGGQMIPDSEGGYKRISEHSPFYRRYYAENGRAPSKTVYRQVAKEQLEGGGGDLIDTEVADAYGLVKNRADEMASLDQAAPERQFVDIVKQPQKDLQGGPGRTRLRSFLQTAQRGDVATPETRKALSKVDPQEYTMQPQAPVMEAAKREVETDYNRAVDYVKDPATIWDDRKSATLQQLVIKAQNEGRGDDALDLLKQLDIEGRGAGRANAMLAAWGRLSPENVLRFAQREVRDAQEGGGKGVLNKISKARKGSPEKLAEDLKEEVEGAAGVTDETVDKAIRTITDEGDEAAEKTVGEKVAKNIETYMSPAKKKKVDELVSQLTTKIKQELIEKKAKAPKKSAVDVLQEVFGRNREALEAFPEAQQILRERFKDNPAVLSQLDNFFGATLDMPAAKSTISRAIKETMKAKEAQISTIIKTSWANQKQSVDDIAAALTKEGFDADSAKVIAKEVTDQMNRDIGAAKKSVLDRLLKDAPEKVKVTFEDKVAKLSNLGALDDADYLTIARKQLELPELDGTTANKISKLAQDMQGLPDGEDKNKVIGEIMDTIASTMPPSAREKFNAFRYQNLLSSPRTQLRNVVANTFNTLITRPATLFTGIVGDLPSSVLTGKPRERYFRELPDYYKGLIKGFFDSHEAMSAAWKGTADITNPDLAEQFGKGGIQQARMRQLPKKWTVVSRLMEAQDRMFSGMIAGGEYAAQIRRGVDPETAKRAAHELAEYSLLRQALDPKNATGQGKLLSGIDRTSQQILDIANNLPGGRWIVPFVRTPLNFAKQWLEFSPAGLANAALTRSMSPERRLEALNKGLLGTSMVGLGATLAADDRITWSVPENATDRDLFYAEGKKPYSIKIGDRWVPLINFGPFGLAMGLPAAVKHNFGDSPDSANDNLADKILSTTLDIGEMLSQQTFLNGISNVVEAVQGGSGDQVGKVLAGLGSQTIPLSGLVRYISTAIDPTYREADGFVQVLQRDIPFASRGLEPQVNSVTGEEVRRNASDYVAPYSIGVPDSNPVKQANTEMAAEFYRSMSRGSNNRNKINDQISEAVLAKDYTKAKSLADEYNTKLKQEALDFKEKFGDRISGNPELRANFNKEYKSRLIKLTPTSVKTRRKNDQKKREFSDSLSR